MIESIAQTSVSLSSAKFASEYSLAVTKMAMQTQENAAETLIAQMMPAPVVSGGNFIDTYA